jgi:hypothetical protein
MRGCRLAETPENLTKRQRSGQWNWVPIGGHGLLGPGDASGPVSRAECTPSTLYFGTGGIAKGRKR